LILAYFAKRYNTITCGWYLLIHLERYLTRPEDSEGNFSICYQPHKGRSNPVKCLAQGRNKRTCQLIFTLFV